MGRLLELLRELKIYGVIAFIAITVWFAALETSLSAQLAELERKPSSAPPAPQTVLADLSE